MQTQQRWIENRPSTGWLARFTLKDLIDWRELAWLLALRDIKLRYKQTFFGVTWAVIQPIAGAALFAVTIGQLTHIPTDGIKYPVFVYAAFIVWAYLSTSVAGAAESLAAHRSLVTKIYFPRLVAPTAAVLPALVDLLVSLPLLALFIMVYGATPTAAVLLTPIWLLAAVAVALPIGVLLSALNVQYRDVRYALPFVMQLWFFASPIVYSSSLLHGVGRYVYALNPAVAVIDGFRWSTLGANAPPAADLVSVASVVFLAIFGLVYFGRVERRFADEI